MPCPAEHELVRAHHQGDEDLIDHVAACARCRDMWNGFDRIVQLARELPVQLPPTGHREEVRTALLGGSSALAPSPHRRSRLLVLAPAAAAVAIAAAVSLWISSRPDDVPAQVAMAPLATVHASENADYTNESRELVRLRNGTLTLDVEPLHEGERFRVVAGDGEVEVRGTSFEVTATGDHLIGVRVSRGRVEVRPAGGAMTVLEPGQSWHVPIVAVTPPAPAPAPVPQPAPAPTKIVVARPHAIAKTHTKTAAARVDAPVAPAPPSPAPAKPAASADEIAYNDAWDAMRSGNFRSAAAAFARVQAGALVDDASFWHAVALARGNHAGEAIIAFRAMIDRFPSSPRTGEASAMLGWLLVDAHQLDEARSRFQAASTDRSEAVRDSAKRGLDALDKR